MGGSCLLLLQVVVVVVLPLLFCHLLLRVLLLLLLLLLLQVVVVPLPFRRLLLLVLVLLLLLLSCCCLLLLLYSVQLQYFWGKNLLVHAGLSGCFHRTLTSWTSGPLRCACDLFAWVYVYIHVYAESAVSISGMNVHGGPRFIIELTAHSLVIVSSEGLVVCNHSRIVSLVWECVCVCVWGGGGHCF